MDSKLFLKVSQRGERTNRIEAFLVFPVAALYFSVMPGRVRTNELVLDTKIKGVSRREICLKLCPSADRQESISRSSLEILLPN